MIDYSERMKLPLKIVALAQKFRLLYPAQEHHLISTWYEMTYGKNLQDAKDIYERFGLRSTIKEPEIRDLYFSDYQNLPIEADAFRIEKAIQAGLEELYYMAELLQPSVPPGPDSRGITCRSGAIRLPVPPKLDSSGIPGRSGAVRRIKS